MATIEVEVTDEEIDRLILEDLIMHYELNRLEYPANRKLVKALKRVIEYHGGKVDG